MAKTHCKRGHLLALVGRSKMGACKACQRKWQKDNYFSPNVQKTVREASWRFDGINLTVEEYDVLFAKQGGRCFICRRHQSEFKKRLAVDHSHTTGEIRGLLCIRCNAFYEWYLNHKPATEAYEQRSLYGVK